MVGFELKRGELTITPDTWGYKPFKVLLNRDKSDDKGTALLEMLFIWHYCRVGSDFEFIRNLDERADVIKRDIGLPKRWTVNKPMKAAISFFNERSTTTLTELYNAALTSVTAVNNYLNRTEELLNERDKYNKPITKINDITTALKSVKVIMKDIKEAYREVIKETKYLERKNVGKQAFNTFEEGLSIE